MSVKGFFIDDGGGIVYAMDRYEGTIRSLAKALTEEQRMKILPSLACQLTSAVASLHLCGRHP